MYYYYSITVYNSMNLHKYLVLRPRSHLLITDFARLLNLELFSIDQLKVSCSCNKKRIFSLLKFHSRPRCYLFQNNLSPTADNNIDNLASKSATWTTISLAFDILRIGTVHQPRAKAKRTRFWLTGFGRSIEMIWQIGWASRRSCK